MISPRDRDADHAVSSMPWPGDAAVAVAIVHIAVGSVVDAAGERMLDGVRVDNISSRLVAEVERGEPQVLHSNERLYSLGVKLTGMGFVISPEEREHLVRAAKKNGERIFPYLGGEEVNAHPTQLFHRYVINFGTMSLDDAKIWPDLLQIVQERVKPERERGRDDQASSVAAKERWWQFWAPRTEFFTQMRRLGRCLVTARVTKHLCFSFQPTDRALNEVDPILRTKSKAA